MRLLAVANQKGGAGKTTTTVNLASVLSESYRTLVVDNDPQGSTTWWSERVGDSLPFDFAPERDPAALSRMRELPYDVVVVDTPGSLEGRDVLATIVEQADFVVLPTEPDALGFPALIETVEKVVKPAGVDYRVLLNKVDPRHHDAERLEFHQLLDGAGLPHFQRVIREYKAHSKAPLLGEVVTQYAESRDTFKAIDDYRRIALELSAIWATQTVGVK